MQEEILKNIFPPTQNFFCFFLFFFRKQSQVLDYFNLFTFLAHPMERRLPLKKYQSFFARRENLNKPPSQCLKAFLQATESPRGLS